MVSCGPTPTLTAPPTETCTPEPISTITPTPGLFGDEVSFEPGTPYAGLAINSGGDVDTEIVTPPRSNRDAFRSGNGQALPSPDHNTVQDYYIQFRVDDDFLYAGSPTTRIVFIIEYLDEGTDTFHIQYDALEGGQYGNGQFKDTAVIHKTGTGQMKTVEIPVCDANFANRDQDSDFRIADAGDGAETIFRVAVRITSYDAEPIEINVDSCGADPFDNLPDSDAIQDCLSQVCSGDTVLFTSGVENPDYQGYMIDKTLFLSYPGLKSDLTFTSTDENNHALLQATADLKGFVVHLWSRSITQNPGLIDNITIEHLSIDGNRAERVCMGDPLPGQERAIGEGENDNWGSWLPECDPENAGDAWCNPGVLYLNGGIDTSDPQQDFAANPDTWSTGIIVQDVFLSNAECGTAFFFSGADFLIDSITVDTAGEHVHVPSCTMTDPDDPVSGWSDGITFLGPSHELTNNLILNPSDIGIVSFGGRDITISGNTIKAEEGNYGMFAGIAMHPNTLGLITGLEVTDNQVINEADHTCGGIHMGINLGVHTWTNGCIGHPTPATYGIAEDCSLSSPAPMGALCSTDTYCRTWGHIPAGGTVTMTGNYVEGAQVAYVISGLDVLGELVIDNNQFADLHLVDWEADTGCVWEPGISDSWGVIPFVAHNPAIPGWVDQRIICAR